MKGCNPQLGNILLKIKDSLLHDGYMDFSYAIRLATEELKKIENKDGTGIEKYRSKIIYQRFKTD